LSTLKAQKLEEFFVLSAGHSPFLVMVLLVKRVIAAPDTAG
jgi:hypothetical protein